MVDLASSLAEAGDPSHSGSQQASKKAFITSMDSSSDSLDANSLLIGFSSGQSTWLDSSTPYSQTMYELL